MRGRPGERLRENPFYVLGVGVEASRGEVERAGQKLLSLLELRIRSAASYPTPLGPEERTPEKVRAALGELRDPSKRVLHEAWATLPATFEEVDPGGAPEEVPAPPPWTEAPDLLLRPP